MSVVTAVNKNDKIFIASDTLESFGDIEYGSDSVHSQKVYKCGVNFVGTTGWGVYGNLVKTFFQESRLKNQKYDSESRIFQLFFDFWKFLKEELHLVNDQAQDDDQPFGQFDSKFIFANNSGIYCVTSNLSVVKFKKFLSIGIGQEVALGALEALYPLDLNCREIAEKSVRIANKYVSGCGSKVQVFEVN